MKPERYSLYSCLWELTLRCNLRCMHCGSVAGKSREKELSLTECMRVAGEIVALKCRELTFIGGEIFLYPGWEKVARYLSDHGVAVNLMSNGFGIGTRQITQILHGRLSNVGISLDGTEAMHNRIRGNPRSFSEIRHSFDALNRANIQIGVVTSLLEMNYPLLEKVYRFLAHNKVTLWQIQLVNPMGNMAGKKGLILDRKHIPALIRFIRNKNRDRQMLVIAADNVGYYYKNSEPCIRGTKFPVCCWTGCGAGMNSLFIDSVGNIKGCGALYDEKFIEGNVRTRSLASIWSDTRKFAYNRKFSTDLLTGNCKKGDVGDVCKGGCRASNFFMKDSLYENAFCPHVCK
jgi:radical SAM protein with 4Fe4S-binding SPASM domain